MPEETRIIELPIGRVEPNRSQPRKTFDKDALKELADSIMEYGLLQPILVTPKDGHYEIVAGERRWRASRMAGLKKVPVVIRGMTEKEEAEIAIIENVQREDLNPVEEAMAYKRLIEEYGMTKEEVASRMAKSRPAVSNLIRILDLPDEILEYVKDGTLSFGHARTLLAIQDEAELLQAAQDVMEQGLSVRALEQSIKNGHFLRGKKQKTKTRKRGAAISEAYLRTMERELTERMGSRVEIHMDKTGGYVKVAFYDEDQLDEIYERLS